VKSSERIGSADAGMGAIIPKADLTFGSRTLELGSALY
jgi:hypothetical protein